MARRILAQVFCGSGCLIQGIKPEPLKEDSSYLVYQRLRLFTNYTGTLHLGRRYTQQEKEACELLDQEIKEYKKITKLSFDEGVPTYGTTTRDDGLISNYDFFDSVDEEFEYLKKSTFAASGELQYLKGFTNTTQP